MVNDNDLIMMEGFVDGYKLVESLKGSQRDVDNFVSAVDCFQSIGCDGADITSKLNLGIAINDVICTGQRKLESKYGVKVLDELGVSERIGKSLTELNNAHKKLCYYDIQFFGGHN